MPESVLSGSARWDDCGQMYPTKLRELISEIDSTLCLYSNIVSYKYVPHYSGEYTALLYTQQCKLQVAWRTHAGLLQTLPALCTASFEGTADWSHISTYSVQSVEEIFIKASMNGSGLKAWLIWYNTDDLFKKKITYSNKFWGMPWTHWPLV